MENNFEETVKLTDVQVSLIYAQYLGQKVLLIPNRSRKPYHLVSVDIRGFVKNEHDKNKGGYYASTCLLLKPLIEISDEDLLAIFAEYRTGSNDRFYRIRNFTKLLHDVLNGIDRFFNALEVIKIADNLRSRGYALPYGEYSVEQLVEAGIYKLIEK